MQAGRLCFGRIQRRTLR